MSDSEEAEFEVESIVTAKVEAASRGKKSKLVWKYRVRWKGYSAEDDTWEPVESFIGSEEMVQAFWERANTDGRDIQNMSLFNIGEEFCPIGPPRRKKRKSKNTATTTEAPPDIPPETGSSNREPAAKNLEKRRHESPDIIEISERPFKRSREAKAQPPQSSSSPQEIRGLRTRSKDATASSSAPPKSSKTRTPRRKPSPEVIPDSDEEANGHNLLRMGYPPPESARQQSKGLATPQKQPSPIVIEDDGPTNFDIDSLFEDDAPTDEPVPAHRARLANPRVKMVDESNFTNMQGGITTKMRAVQRVAAEASTSNADLPSPKKSKRPKPGPGRSSVGHITLLTADKRGLKGVKTKPRQASGHKPSLSKASQQEIDPGDMDVDDAADKNPPSAEELLQLAGLDVEAAEALPDFDDPVPDDNSINPVSNAPKSVDESSSRKESLNIAKDNLFPIQSPPSPPASTSTWSRPTIFGPLSLGFDSINPSDQSTTSQLFLNLDASIAIPTFFTDAPTSTKNSFSRKMENNSVPGKFYQTNAALSLLGTVRATGESAIITLTEDATPDDKENFALFHDRLKAGDIFVSVAGMNILVFCSSSNTLLSARLNAPPALLNQPDKVLVSQVDVENYSGYADAAADADNRRWSQYIATKN